MLSFDVFVDSITVLSWGYSPHLNFEPELLPASRERHLHLQFYAKLLQIVTMFKKNFIEELCQFILVKLSNRCWHFFAGIGPIEKAR